MFGGETLYAGSETEQFDALSLVNLEHVSFEIYEERCPSLSRGCQSLEETMHNGHLGREPVWFAQNATGRPCSREVQNS